MQVTVISPERAVFEGPAAAVLATAFDGLVGILPRHAPFMTLLGTGTLTIREGKGAESRRFQVSGGFLQVTGETVRVVVARAE